MGHVVPTEIIQEFDAHCGCFSGNAWNAAVNYVLGNTVVHGGLYYNSKQDANLNHEPPDDDWWWPLTPFGGAGKTPRFYTLFIKDVVMCPGKEADWRDPNGIQIAEQAAVGGFECWWYVDWDPGDPNPFGFFPRFGDPIRTRAGNQWENIKTTIYYEHSAPVRPCVLVGINLPNRSICGAHIFMAGHEGTISWRPGQYPVWDGNAF